METAVQIASIAIIVAVCGCILRPQVGPVAAVLSIMACTAILFLVFQFLNPVIEVLERLRRLSGLTDSATAPMLKVAGISILTQVAGCVCEDAGEKTLHGAVETGGTILSLYISMPLLSAVLDLLEEMLGR